MRKGKKKKKTYLKLKNRNRSVGASPREVIGEEIRDRGVRTDRSCGIEPSEPKESTKHNNKKDQTRRI
jgi:hypothetical protein